MTQSKRGGSSEEDPPAHALDQGRGERGDGGEQEERDGSFAEYGPRAVPVDASAIEPRNDDQHGEQQQLTHWGMRERMGRRAALALTILRVALAPVVLLLAVQGSYVRYIALTVIIATVSDIYDGRIARHFGVVTPDLRRFDSMADTIFYAAVGVALWISHPEMVRSHALLFVVFIAMQVVGMVIDVWKFGRETSYHAWTARAFGVSLLVSMTVVFWTGQGGGWLTLALVMGMISHVDAFIITMLLPEWHHDVGTIPNALRLRREFMQRRTL